MQGTSWEVLLLGAFGLALGAAALHAFRFQRWYVRETRGAAYFSRPLAERRSSPPR